jgi:protein gp37
MLNPQKGNMYPFVTDTWNTVKGRCLHACIYCYMLVYNLNPMRFDASELKTDLGKDRYIFVGSSCDMWANDVPEEWLRRTIEHILKYPDNTYLFQTKNPDRFTRYVGFPPFVVLGVTIETNRDYKMSKAPVPSERIDAFLSIEHPRKMVSIEPIMDFDIDVLVQWMKEIKPEFVSVGADSKGHNLPEPTSQKIEELIAALNKFTDVREKNNLKRIYDSKLDRRVK